MPTPVPRAPPAAPKRKAECELTNGPSKRPTTPANIQNDIAKRPTTPNNAPNGPLPKARPPIAAVGGGEYKGAARLPATTIVKQPDSKAQTASFAPVAVAKPVPKPTPPAAKPAKPAVDKPAPKQGSYAAIMARAKAAQDTKPAFGVITHKQTEKTAKKDRVPEGSKGKNGLVRDRKAGDRSRTGSAEAMGKAGKKEKHKPKPLEKSDYRGTAKPTTPVYGGSARPGQNAKPSKSRGNEYADWSDLDDIDDEEEEDYGSDESDMEAGAFDIDREEQEALRLAKKDDAAELALENRLKAEKLQRKQRLQQLVNDRAKRKPY